jgi:hypothetical protein
MIKKIKLYLQFRVAIFEEEMKIVLIESENTKKQYEEKLKSCRKC